MRPALSDCVPSSAPAASICRRCLTVAPADTGEADPDFSEISDAFPSGDAGVAFALALGLCDSLATNRRALETTLDAVERDGVDPLLAFDRVLADPSVEPAIDLDRRRSQLESLLY